MVGFWSSVRGLSSRWRFWSCCQHDISTVLMDADGHTGCPGQTPSIVGLDRHGIELRCRPTTDELPKMLGRTCACAAATNRERRRFQRARHGDFHFAAARESRDRTRDKVEKQLDPVFNHMPGWNLPNQGVLALADEAAGDLLCGTEIDHSAGGSGCPGSCTPSSSPRAGGRWSGRWCSTAPGRTPRRAGKRSISICNSYGLNLGSPGESGARGRRRG